MINLREGIAMATVDAPSADALCTTEAVQRQYEMFCYFLI